MSTVSKTVTNTYVYVKLHVIAPPMCACVHTHELAGHGPTILRQWLASLT